MNADTGTDAGAGLPAITRIDTDALIRSDEPGVRIWLDNGAQIQLHANEHDGIERQWFSPDNTGDPRKTEVVGEASRPDTSIDGVGLDTVAAYLAFEDEADARAEWGHDVVDVLLGE